MVAAVNRRLRVGCPLCEAFCSSLVSRVRLSVKVSAMRNSI